ncbi:hypothetical protein B0H66DRAFT_382543 [Apodospora peruviana]|uniref:C3H1-type domain-containing protein n=1 Tax=Apodospora peruviana TaxID=516989 RepID=A0AAE0HUP2_9PEZI|nr:hypothetical protein B0H66DRAFT_382543 [Apodospora peruviana]
MAPAVCKFYQQGFCRNGANCRFEHPPKHQPPQQPANRWGVLAGGAHSQGMNTRVQEVLPYSLSPDVIQKDLSSEVPTWILSCYGPGKDAPEQLFGGPGREQSFEEMRLYYMQGLAAGNPQGALNDINTLYQEAQNQIRRALSDTNAAVKFIADAANKHPNRIDICQQGTPAGGTSGEFARDKPNNALAFGNTANAFQNTNRPFGAPAAAPSAFGQPSGLGQKPNPFGAPAFGQPAQTSPFGQGAAPSAFGQPAQPAQGPTAFGQPTPVGGAKPNPFGAPAFGQPPQPAAAPAFGQPSQPTSTFGQPAALGAKPNPFGAPAFGQPAQPATAQPAANPFGQPAQAAANPFGQPAAAPANNNPFGQPSATPAANPFGQPAPVAAAAPATNPFGQPAATNNNPFGAPATNTPPSSNPFGQPPAENPFGQPAAAAAAAQQQPASNPFGQPAGNSFAGNTFASITPSPAPPAAAAPATTKVTGQDPYEPGSSRQHPDMSSYSSKGADGRVRIFKGKMVTWQALPSNPGKEVPVLRNFNGSFARVWFPDGPPAYSTETEGRPEDYADEKVMQQWGAFVNTGRFEAGIMPEVPPKREFCTWDF